MSTLKPLNIVKDTIDHRILATLLKLASERNKSKFINVCGKKFASFEDLTNFLKKFPPTSFILADKEMEIEYGVFLNYLGNVQEHFWPESSKTQELIFQTPKFNRESFRFRSFNGSLDNKMSVNDWLK